MLGNMKTSVWNLRKRLIYIMRMKILYIFAWQEIDARKYSYWYVYDRNTKYREPIKITSKDVIWQVNHKGNRISDDYLFYKLLTYKRYNLL